MSEYCLTVGSDGTFRCTAGDDALRTALADWAKDNLRLRTYSPQGSPRDVTLELQVRTAVIEEGAGLCRDVWETVSEVSL